MIILKVALISQEFPPFFFGGVGSYCYNLAHNLAKKGIHVTVFTSGLKEIETNEISKNLNVVRLPNFDFPIRPLWFQIRNYKVFPKMLNDYDVIHIGDVQSGILPTVIAKQLKKPIVTSIHSVPPIYTLKDLFHHSFRDLSLGDIGLDFFENPFRTFAMKFCLQNSTHAIFCGSYALEKTKSHLLDIDIKRTTVIYNGINFDEIEQCLSRSDENPIDDSKIVFVGRLFYLKGIIYLINALEELKKNLKHFSLEIFGTGPLQNKLLKLVSHLGLENEVNFRGFITDHLKLLKEIRSANVVAIPSAHEVGPSIAALEAMACSKPIVAFDKSFTREFIVNMQTGLLVKPYNVSDFAKKLYLLLTNSKLGAELGGKAHKYVREKHNWNTLVNRYIETYDAVLNSP
jgi:glycosyltransferase involved in cell wall biosynthesis